MQRAIIIALLLFFPIVLHARVIKWEGKPISVSISTERLTRIEFAENLRSVFLSRSDIGVEREERSLYVRALAPDVDDALFVVGGQLSSGVRPVNLDNLILRPANPQAKTPFGIFLQP